jgi:hypothetical protein
MRFPSRILAVLIVAAEGVASSSIARWQRPTIFEDGFESGPTSAWSNAE